MIFSGFVGQGRRRWGLLGCGPWCRQSRQGQSKGSTARKQGLHGSLFSNKNTVPARTMKKPAKSAELSAEAKPLGLLGQDSTAYERAWGAAQWQMVTFVPSATGRIKLLLSALSSSSWRRFDLANTLCAHAIHSSQLVQRHATRAIVVHLEPTLFHNAAAALVQACQALAMPSEASTSRWCDSMTAVGSCDASDR